MLFFVFLLVLGNFGARVLEAIETILTNGPAAEQYTFWEMVVGKQGGRRWFGALLVNFVAVYLLIKITGKISLLGLLDEILIVASGGVVIGKIGCFLSGHGCYGVPTNWIVGMRVPYGSMPSILPVHPTALYDAIIYAVLFVVLWRLSKNKKYDGQITIVFLFTVCIASILVEVIRINEPVIFNMSLAQIVYAFLLIGTIVFYRNRKRTLAAA